MEFSQTGSDELLTLWTSTVFNTKLLFYTFQNILHHQPQPGTPLFTRKQHPAATEALLNLWHQFSVKIPTLLYQHWKHKWNIFNHRWPQYIQTSYSKSQKCSAPTWKKAGRVAGASSSWSGGSVGSSGCWASHFLTWWQVYFCLTGSCLNSENLQIHKNDRKLNSLLI